MPTVLQLRRGTAPEWSSANPTLASGEVGIETNTNLFKIGNGVTSWNSLSYGGVQGAQGIQGVQGVQGLNGAFAAQGYQGPQGYQGVQGRQGIQGIQGSQAAQGLQGIQGVIGLQGTTWGKIKSISIPTPTSSDVFTMFFTPEILSLSKIESVLVGTSTPSVTFTIRYASDRSLTGTEVVTGGITVTSTSGLASTSFNSGTRPANSFVWVSVSAVSGTVTELALSLLF